MKGLMCAVAIVASLLYTNSVDSAGQTKDYSPYKQAIQELKQRQRKKVSIDWAVVEKAMRVALKTDSFDSGKEVGSNLLRVGGEDYFPNFYLGLALSYLGNCTEALNSFDESERHIEVTKRAELTKVLNDRSEHCEQRGFMRWQKRDASVRQAIEARAKADEAAKALREYANQNRAHWNDAFRLRETKLLDDRDAAQTSTDSGLSRRHAVDAESGIAALGRVGSGCATLLEEFKRHVASAAERAKETNRPLVPELSDKGGAASAISPESAALQEKGTRDFEAARKRAANQQKRLSERSPASANYQAIVGGLKTANGALDKAWKGFETARARSDDNEMRKALQALGSVQVQIDEVAALLGPAVAAANVPETLMTGASLFFKTHYREALDALTPEVLDNTGASVKPHFHAIRAAAHFGLFDSDGRKNQELKQLAQEEVKNCKRLKLDFELNLLAFSPRFIEFFKGVSLDDR